METELLDQIDKALAAENLYNNDMIQGFIKDTENAIIYAIKNSKWDEIEKREDLCKMMKTVDQFKSMFVFYMERGENAKKMLKNLRSGALDKI